MEGQPTLKAWVEPETVTKKYLTYATQWHKIRLSEGAIEGFLKRIGKKTKAGKATYTDKEQHLKMCDFILKRAKVKVEKMDGYEWEMSMRFLLMEVFKEPWDRDYDKDGKSVSTSQQFANAVSALKEAGVTSIELVST